MAEVLPVASLPMYDWPEVASANDALWASIARHLRDRGIDVPAALDRSRPFGDEWRDPGLVLSQTCGLPFSTRLTTHVRLVGTPIYDVPGCAGPLYCSMIVVRSEETGPGLAGFARRRFAFNASDSLSGSLALRAAMRDSGLDPRSVGWVETGSHRASVRAVARGEADVAAIDAVCWALAQPYEREASRALKVLASTTLRPGLPFITAIGRGDAEVAAIRSSIEDALADADTKAARQALRLAGLATIDASDYAPIAALSRALG